MKSELFTFFSLVVLFSACQKDDFNLQQKYVNMYVELLIAHENYKSDSTKFFQAKNGALSNYDFDYQEMKTHIKELEKRPEHWEKFQSTVLERIKELKTNHKGD